MKVTSSFDGALNVLPPSVGIFAEWGSLFGGRRQKAMRCWTLDHPDQLVDYMMVQYVIDCLSKKHSATMVGVSRSCSEFHFRWRRRGSFRDPDLVAASRNEA